MNIGKPQYILKWQEYLYSLKKVPDNKIHLPSNAQVYQDESNEALVAL